jgi:DNA-binding GntR family transcriptional regulator
MPDRARRTGRSADLVREALEQDIVTGRFVPGQRLDEVKLAERFGVSRTPVREALHELAAGGLLQLWPRRGAIVAQLGPERLFEMFEVMAELEGMCGRLAARRAGDEDRDRLVQACEACAVAAQEGDTDTYYYENELFHRLIQESAGNGFLAEEARRLSRRLRPYRRLQLRVRNRMRASLAEHRAIVEAIGRGDPAAAEAQLKAHVIIQGERFSDLVASLPQLHTAAE